MTEQEENYIHFASCIENFNKAWKILQEIKKDQGNSIFRGWGFEFALIEYSKPYTLSFGELRKQRLEDKFIPSQHLDLHKRIIDARNKIHAHSDLTVKEAKLIVKNLESGKFVSILQNLIDPTVEFKNIDPIIDLVEQTINKMYLERESMERDLSETDS